MTATNKSRAKARKEATDAVIDTWDTWSATHVETNAPEFWSKYAAHDEAMADAYRALNRVTDDRALAMALLDAEWFRRERAQSHRLHAEQAKAGIQ